MNMKTNFKTFFAYLTEDQFFALKRFSADTGVSMSQVIRESVDARLSKGDQYVAGYNQAITDVINTINSNNLSKMAFPSGKTFREVIIEDISAHVRHHDGTGRKDPQHPEEEIESLEKGITPDAGAAA